MSDENDRKRRSANKRDGVKRRALLLGTTCLVTASAVASASLSSNAQAHPKMTACCQNPNPRFAGKSAAQ
jgi:hypothetical protein